jgi:hypothetical protein
MSSSLELCQVLEEEYLNLHGTLAYNEPVTLPGSRCAIAPRLDWEFDKGHIKDACTLRRRLRSSTSLFACLHGHSKEFDEELPNSDVPISPKDDEASLIVALNTLLGVPHLYDEQKCGAASERVREILRRFDSTLDL